MWKIQVDDEAPDKMLSSALIPGGNLMLMRCFLKLNSSFFIWSQLLPCGLTPEPGSLISAARPPGTSSSSVSTLAFLDVPLLGVNITDQQGHTRFGQESVQHNHQKMTKSSPTDQLRLDSHRTSCRCPLTSPCPTPPSASPPPTGPPSGRSGRTISFQESLWIYIFGVGLAANLGVVLQCF